MIADLGLSKQETESNSSSIVFGMPAYVEPQCYKMKFYKRDKKSDIYSLGVLLWELSSGESPFTDLATHAIIIDIFSGNREKPIEGTPSDYVQLYQKCWDDDPNSRPDIEQVYKVLTQLKSQIVNEQIDSNIIKNFNSLNIKDPFTLSLSDNIKLDLSQVENQISKYCINILMN